MTTEQPKESFADWLTTNYQITEVKPEEHIRRPLEACRDEELRRCVGATVRVAEATARHPAFPCAFFNLDDAVGSDGFISGWRAGVFAIFRITNRETGKVAFFAAIDNAKK